MKKLLALMLILLALVGCTPANNQDTPSTNRDTEVVKIYKGTYFDLLPEELRNELLANNYQMEDGEISVIGADLSSYTFKTVDGVEMQLPKEGPYILEIVGSWCGYCQNLVNGVIGDELYKEIPVYQYFMYGNADDVATFYQAVNREKPAEITAFVENEQFEMLLQEHNFYSVPLTLVVDASGKVAMTHLGYLEVSDYRTFIEYAKAAKIYDVKVEDVSLSEYIVRQDKIRKYIDSLEEIEVPKSIFE